MSATGDGALLTRQLGGEPRRWVVVEPLVFRKADGQDTMVFREDGEGRITALFFDSSLTWAFVKLAWYETPAFHVGLLATCVVLFLSRLARWLAGGAGALSELYLIG